MKLGELSKRTKALAEEQASSKGKSEMFHFNHGKQRKVFPDYNPYTIKRCNDCDLAKRKFGKMDANELCAECALLRTCEDRICEEVIRYQNGGSVLKHPLVSRDHSDYDKLIGVAKFFAQKDGERVVLTPKISRPPKFEYEEINILY